LVKNAKPDFSVFLGYDEYLLQNLMYGGDGIIRGLSNVFPEILIELNRAFNNDNALSMWKFSKKLIYGMTIMEISSSNIGAIKVAVCFRIDGACYHMREPGPELDQKTSGDIRSLIDSIK
jgi:2-dehydro-3-deoxy-D-pentonate aldolase